MIQTLEGSHNIACKLHAITEDFQSSREAPNSHIPSFAALPSENLDFHKKSYFYLRGGGRQRPWIPPPWGLPKAWKFMEITFGGPLEGRSRSEVVIEGAQSALERPKVSEGDQPSCSETDFGPFWIDFEAVWGGSKCSVRRQGRVAEHFC